MRYLLVFFICVCGFGFTLNINTGKFNGNDYFVVHLEDAKPITCEEKTQNSKIVYVCKIGHSVDQELKDQDLKFAQIYFRNTNDGFFVLIAPNGESKLLNSDINIFSQDWVKQKQISPSRHFSIIIDKNINKNINSYSELDFPITFPDMINPYIGALDLNKEPLDYKPGADINVLETLKNQYERGAYDISLQTAQEAIKDHPDSIFISEFWVYLMRSQLQLAQSEEDPKKSQTYADNLVQNAKSWTKTYPGDTNYAEVLYMGIKANLLKDTVSDAMYNLDILQTEHPKSIWSKKALVAYADYLVETGKDSEAEGLYSDVLYGTDDLELASDSSLKLALISIKMSRNDQAKNLINKIIQANPKFLNKDKETILSIADLFREKGDIEFSSSLYKIIFEGLDKNDDLYEPTLRNLAVMLSSEPKFSEQARLYLKLYQDEFPQSPNMELIQTAFDKTFFDIEHNDTKSLHDNYRDLMDKYKGQAIARKALFEEIKLLQTEKKFQEILDLKALVEDSNSTETYEILSQAALEVANKHNQNKNCIKAVSIVKEYNLAEKIDDKFKLHQCFMQTSFFQDALNLAQSNVRTQDLNARIEWLVAASQALYKLQRYDECIKACDDAITIATKVAQSDPSKALYYRFYSLIAKKRFNEAISNVLALEELRGGEDRLTEVYDTAAKFAILNGFDSAALNYSQKAIKMQKRLNIDTFSPEIDFIYVNALLKNSQTKDALKAAQNLLKLNLNDEQKSRALYQNAEIYLKLDDKTNAKNMIDECLKQPGKSAWKNLCIEQNQIIKN